MNGQETEGVIKFSLVYTASTLPPELPGFTGLDQCRRNVWQMGVVGQDDSRYQGLGYGNVSLRLRDAQYPDAFLITGTQTGHLPHLSADHYARVLGYDIDRNWLQADGPAKPSSEAMTHAAIYQCAPDANAIIHGHSPAIWWQAQLLGLGCTAAEIPFGTPEMARAMQALLKARKPLRNTIVMLGHQDGFITWGKGLAEAVALVRELLQDADSPTQ